MVDSREAFWKSIAFYFILESFDSFMVEEIFLVGILQELSHHFLLIISLSPFNFDDCQQYFIDYVLELVWCMSDLLQFIFH